jgi:hypothetical protein
MLLQSYRGGVQSHTARSNTTKAALQWWLAWGITAVPDSMVSREEAA